MDQRNYRQDQIQVARKATNRGQGYNGQRSHKPAAPKGHDALLKAAQDNRTPVIIVTMSDGAAIEGVVVARDKFTITLEIRVPQSPDVSEFTYKQTFYKHAIESFRV